MKVRTLKMAKCPNCNGCLEYGKFNVSKINTKILKTFICELCKKYFIYVEGKDKLIEVKDVTTYT